MSDLDSRQRVSSENHVRLARATSSMLWAAWADALGFISEITDERGLRARTKGRELSETMEWTRRVGGKFGVQAQLPAGCYSDDTQLRLATSRAISNDGFDVEAFAKIELTVWPSYALGGGRASKAAASSMAKSSSSWFTNFYQSWTESGGNGAAMRIQPHVYASAHLESREFVRDVIRNSVTTHGHPRALVGAVFHALTLGFSLSRGKTPSPRDWIRLISDTHASFELFRADIELDSYWRPRWEAEAGMNFEDAWHVAVEECNAMLVASEEFVEIFQSLKQGDRSAQDRAYSELGGRLGLSDPSTRGSGTATVVAATVLAASLPTDPYSASTIAARAVGTDTDTIATMAAALIGAATGLDAPSGIQDLDYLRNEANRLTLIAIGIGAPKFSYPDILKWVPPTSQLDVVGLVDGQPSIAGLGRLAFTSPPNSVKEATWQWATTSFGPTVLIKHRQDLPELPAGNWPRLRARVEERDQRESTRTSTDQERVRPRQPVLFEEEDDGRSSRRSSNSGRSVRPKKADDAPLDVDKLLAWVQTRGYEDDAIGEAVRRIASEGTLEQMAVFIGAIRPQLRVRGR